MSELVDVDHVLCGRLVVALFTISLDKIKFGDEQLVSLEPAFVISRIEAVFNMPKLQVKLDD